MILLTPFPAQMPQMLATDRQVKSVNQTLHEKPALKLQSEYA